MSPVHDVFEIAASLAGSFITATFGVLMRHSHRAANGIPWNFGRVMLDAPTIVVMGVTAGAVGKYLETQYAFPEITSLALAANFGYLGPAFVDRLFLILEKQIEKKEDKKTGE